MINLAIDAVLAQHQIVLCGGTGGVGKTTMAAALGVRGAQLGRKTLVITIDPARRLAQALGLTDLQSVPQPIERVAHLYAMMLDPGDTMDALVQRYAATADEAQKFLTNPYYRQISATVAGSREFMAMEKLHELATSGTFELIIVDTPPSQHALDFIDAPKRLIEVLDGSGLGILLHTNALANRLSFGLLGRSQRQFGKLFERLTGQRLLIDLDVFFSSYSDVIQGFRSRARALENLLRSESSTFVLVMNAASEAVDIAQRYQQRLNDEQIAMAGVIFNQVHQVAELPLSAARLMASADAAGVPQDLAQRALDCHNAWLMRSRTDALTFAACQAHTSLPAAQVPRLTHDLSSMDDLLAIAQVLTTAAP